jgi:hypothetical protein
MQIWKMYRLLRKKGILIQKRLLHPLTIFKSFGEFNSFWCSTARIVEFNVVLMDSLKKGNEKLADHVLT